MKTQVMFLTFSHIKLFHFKFFLHICGDKNPLHCTFAYCISFANFQLSIFFQLSATNKVEISTRSLLSSLSEIFGRSHFSMLQHQFKQRSGFFSNNLRWTLSFVDIAIVTFSRIIKMCSSYQTRVGPVMDDRWTINLWDDFVQSLGIKYYRIFVVLIYLNMQIQ